MIIGATIYPKRYPIFAVAVGVSLSDAMHARSLGTAFSCPESHCCWLVELVGAWDPFPVAFGGLLPFPALDVGLDACPSAMTADPCALELLY